MGNSNSVNPFSKKEKQLLVRTGIKSGKGTNANIQVILYNKDGRKTNAITLDCKFRNDFESGQTDNFPIDLRSEEGNPLDDITEIELWRDDSGLSSDWFCDVIILLDPETGHSVPFPVQRWVRPNFHYKIKAHDTLLPQDDPNKPHRTLELDYKRTLYQYSGKDKKLPGSIDKLPEDEEFSTKYFLEVLAKPSAKATITNFFANISLPRQWRSIDDIKKAFGSKTYELPKVVV